MVSGGGDDEMDGLKVEWMGERGETKAKWFDCMLCYICYAMAGWFTL